MKARIEFEVEAPVDCTEEEFIEWIRFEINDNGSMSLKNPLVDSSLDIIGYAQIDII